jgi:hydroxypyruvate isomerase
MVPGLEPTMRLSAPDWCFFREGMDPVVYYRLLRALGFSAVEMVAPSRWQAARDAGLAILNLSGPGKTVGLNRLGLHGELLPAIRRQIAVAGDAGIPHLIVFSGNRDGQDDGVGRSNVVTALKALAGDAERAGVTLIFEMFNDQDHPDYQADRSAYGFEVVRAVGSPAVKVLYDIYHMSRMGEDVVGDITGNLELIAHLHTAEKPRRSIPRRDGAIPYGEIVPAVMAKGYAGYWGLEFVVQGDVMGELRQALLAF